MLIPSHRSRNRMIIGGGVTLSLAAAALGYVYWHNSAGADDGLPSELSVASLKAMSDDPEKMRSTMRDAMENGNLTEEQRRQAFQNMREVWQGKMNERVNEYFAATDDEKDAILDQHLDEFEQHRQSFEGRPGGGPGGAGGPGQGRPGGPGGPGGRGGFGSQSQQERKARSESRNPDDSARQMSYFSALRKRAEQRGMKIPFGPGGRRGGNGP